MRFNKALIVEDQEVVPTTEPNGTLVTFIADKELFGNYHYIMDYLEAMFKNYVFLNSGLTINFNGQKLHSKRGLYDLLSENMSGEGLYPIIHLRGNDIDARAAIRGRVLLFRERSAHDARGNALGRFSGSCGENNP